MSDRQVISKDHTKARSSHKLLKSFKAQVDLHRSPSEKFADFMTDLFGSIWFLTLNIVWFLTWVILNTNIIPGLKAFDPFPFGLLTTIVSLEAIVLAIVVLISQNRAAKIADLREEIDLQFDITSESEITEVLKLLTLLLEKNGIDVSKDQRVKHMLKPVTREKIQLTLQKEIDHERK